MQNVTNSQAKLYDYYNARKGEVEYAYQLPLLPVMYYKIEF
ncbi:MAG: hypothetical protein WD077_03320 [Bacteroidia bacterium]